jgi:hypothetical protein
MPNDLRVVVDGKTYECDIALTLEDLTGDETLEIEDFLGGWENFDEKGGSARSVYVLYFLAKRANDPKVKLKDVTSEKGVVFGNRVDIQDIEEAKGETTDPPADAPAEGAIHSTQSEVSDDSGAGSSQSDTA